MGRDWPITITIKIYVFKPKNIDKVYKVTMYHINYNSLNKIDIDYKKNKDQTDASDNVLMVRRVHAYA